VAGLRVLHLNLPIYEFEFVICKVPVTVNVKLIGIRDFEIWLVLRCDGMCDGSDDEEEEEETLETDTGFGNVIIVDNLPVVAFEKYEKLEGVIRKIFGQIGVITTNGLLMPRDESGKTKGYAFIEYSTPQVLILRGIMYQ
jgi:hypothetical protein